MPMTVPELRLMSDEELEDTIRAAMRQHGSLRATCKALGWDYNFVTNRIYQMGLISRATVWDLVPNPRMKRALERARRDERV